MAFAVVLSACALLLSGCGQSGGDLGATPGVSLQPGTTQQAEPSCESGPLGCSEFTSVRGSDAEGDVAWLGTEPLKVSSTHINGEWTMLVKTPCNVLNVAVSVQENVLTTRSMAVSAMGCSEPKGSYEAWTIKLFEKPVQWKRDGGMLTLSNAHATIELKES
ncbi:META domain-containing protein [Paenarthrobacter sp. NPDC092416]|uniref:META domain-containing protein n=1 Tax=Paenarthrobacter sp. NPDC092416 TaxID=3364386 RepID=UPI003810DBFE